MVCSTKRVPQYFSTKARAVAISRVISALSSSKSTRIWLFTSVADTGSADAPSVTVAGYHISLTSGQSAIVAQDAVVPVAWTRRTRNGTMKPTGAAVNVI